jgi:hypothetical protein
VLLRRALLEMGRDAHHYGISIVRDRGIDKTALEAIIQAHGAENIVFVDGWTGKGAISGEIQRSLNGDSRFLKSRALWCWQTLAAERGFPHRLRTGLFRPASWCDGVWSGFALHLARDGGLHGCVVYDHLREHDLTREFIERIEAERQALGTVPQATPWTDTQRFELQGAAATRSQVAGLPVRHYQSQPGKARYCRSNPRGTASRTGSRLGSQP